ncbi:hypothetical protein [Natronobacterium gregoryi]|uniref:Uncharacterized protein n=2 Tax=Natronobacterium gregoryi TaxID=44930 RepID=L0AIX8_NATGS|nr:hypothetical protein [Natronobacterium gregoryi]AFZ73858.1 hypothetical protein Natgr_2709 [Natronobacterium gregoryi SP2]SFJ42630.1 hypothetical protein SAMN05443661_12847 [Natronobacterium gregoryi]
MQFETNSWIVIEAAISSWPFGSSRWLERHVQNRFAGTNPTDTVAVASDVSTWTDAADRGELAGRANGGRS